MFNEIQGRIWPELARRLFGGARVYQVAPEIAVNVDLFGRPELWALHAGSLLIGVQTGVGAGGAGNRSQMAISMVPAANAFFVLERIVFSTGVADNLVLALSATDLTTSTGNLVARDTRRIVTAGGSAPCQARIRTQNNAALANIATTVGGFIIPANSSLIVDLDMVIGPGWSLRIYPTADNVALSGNVTFIGRERVATPDELLTL